MLIRSIFVIAAPLVVFFGAVTTSPSRVWAACVDGAARAIFSYEERDSASQKSQLIEDFIASVNNRTGTDICIQAFGGGALGLDKDMPLEILEGNLQLAMPRIDMLSPIDTDLSSLALPFLFRGPDHMIDFVGSKDAEGLFEKVERRGVKVLGLRFSGSLLLLLAKEPSGEFAFDGLKLKVSDAGAEDAWLGAVGARPVRIARGEVLAALQLGIIDGAFGSMEEVRIWSKGLPDGAVIAMDHSPLLEVLIASAEWWQSLPQGIQEDISSVASEIFEKDRVRRQKFSQISIDKIESGGLKIVSLTPAQRQHFAQDTSSLREAVSDELLAAIDAN